MHSPASRLQVGKKIAALSACHVDVVLADRFTNRNKEDEGNVQRADLRFKVLMGSLEGALP